MNEGKLKGRIALVTGGGRGIGRAITLALAAQGAEIVICGRDAQALQATCEEVKQFGAPAFLFVVDAMVLGEVQKLFQNIKECIGRLDILVNNIGGVKQFAQFDGLNDADWREAFEENLMTTVRMTREALPLLLQSKNASIVNIASVAGVQAGWFNCHYGSMKAAMIHLTKYLANNYGRQGVRANAIAMSTIKGGVWERDVKNKAHMDNISLEEAEVRLEKEVKSKTVLGMIGTPEDVANTAIFLASDDSKFVTGSCLYVDGGTVKAI